MNDLRLIWTESRSDNDRVTYVASFEDYYLQVMPDAHVYWVAHNGSDVAVGSLCQPRGALTWEAQTYELQYTAECIMQGHWLAHHPDRYGEGAYMISTRDQWLSRERTEEQHLYECADCSAKPGVGPLCSRCLTARSAAGSAWRGARHLYDASR